MSSCPRAQGNWFGTAASARNQLVLRVNGKKKTEAFLFEHGGPAGRRWKLRDGTVSDGKVETYEKAVAEILCPADTFFTSVFSAQGKRPLSAFKNAEIKTLLADLLGLEQVRQQGALAADVVKQLKAGLAVVRQGLARAQEDAAGTRRSLAELDGASQALLCGNGPTNFDSREAGRCAPEAGHGHRRAHWRRRD